MTRDDLLQLSLLREGELPAAEAEVLRARMAAEPALLAAMQRLDALAAVSLEPTDADVQAATAALAPAASAGSVVVKAGGFTLIAALIVAGAAAFFLGDETPEVIASLPVEVIERLGSFGRPVDLAYGPVHYVGKGTVDHKDLKLQIDGDVWLGLEPNDAGRHGIESVPSIPLESTVKTFTSPLGVVVTALLISGTVVQAEVPLPPPLFVAGADSGVKPETKVVYLGSHSIFPGATNWEMKGTEVVKVSRANTGLHVYGLREGEVLLRTWSNIADVKTTLVKVEYFPSAGDVGNLTRVIYVNKPELLRLGKIGRWSVGDSTTLKVADDGIPGVLTITGLRVGKTTLETWSAEGVFARYGIDVRPPRPELTQEDLKQEATTGPGSLTLHVGSERTLTFPAIASFGLEPQGPAVARLEGDTALVISGKAKGGSTLTVTLKDGKEQTFSIYVESEGSMPKHFERVISVDAAESSITMRVHEVVRLETSVVTRIRSVSPAAELWGRTNGAVLQGNKAGTFDLTISHDDGTEKLVHVTVVGK